MQYNNLNEEIKAKSEQLRVEAAEKAMRKSRLINFAKQDGKMTDDARISYALRRTFSNDFRNSFTDEMGALNYLKLKQELTLTVPVTSLEGTLKSKLTDPILPLHRRFMNAANHVRGRIGWTLGLDINLHETDPEPIKQTIEKDILYRQAKYLLNAQGFDVDVSNIELNRQDQHGWTINKKAHWIAFLCAASPIVIAPLALSAIVNSDVESLKNIGISATFILTAGIAADRVRRPDPSFEISIKQMTEAERNEWENNQTQQIEHLATTLNIDPTQLIPTGDGEYELAESNL